MAVIFIIIDNLALFLLITLTVPGMVVKKIPHDSILIVDDEIDIARCIKRFLETYGFQVSAFANPLLALKEFYSNCDSYNLIISDYNMKDMTLYYYLQTPSSLAPPAEVTPPIPDDEDQDTEEQDMSDQENENDDDEDEEQ